MTVREARLAHRELWHVLVDKLPISALNDGNITLTSLQGANKDYDNFVKLFNSYIGYDCTTIIFQYREEINEYFTKA